MTLFDIYMISVIVNFFMGIKVNINIYKAFADKGYIFNKRLLKEIERMDLEEESLVNQTIYECTPIIPFYNLLITGMTQIEYCTYTDDYIEDFERVGIIERMTYEETTKYNKWKSGIYAMLMRLKLNIKRRNLCVIEYNDGSRIYFDYDYSVPEDKLLDSIIIIEVRGNAEKKSMEELRNMVIKSHFTVGEAILNTYDDSDEFFESYNRDKNVELLLDTNVIQDMDEGIKDKGTCKKRIKKKESSRYE